VRTTPAQTTPVQTTLDDGQPCENPLPFATLLQYNIFQ
jgi:hypothetical protein